MKKINKKNYLREYSSWSHMKSRCNNKKDVKYVSYGGKGVTVCDEWNKFSNFFADMGERPKGTTLDRIDGNKGYFPENCRWVESSIQNINRGIFKNNKLGLKGVTFVSNSRTNPYRVRVGKNGKQITVGRVETAIEGAILYDKTVVALYGEEFASTNAEDGLIELYRKKEEEKEKEVCTQGTIIA